MSEINGVKLSSKDLTI